jgi:hypothetical protein
MLTSQSVYFFSAIFKLPSEFMTFSSPFLQSHFDITISVKRRLMQLDSPKIAVFNMLSLCNLYFERVIEQLLEFCIIKMGFAKA